MVYEIQPQGLLANLLATFEEVRGVIDYVLIGGISPEQYSDSYAFHKVGAIFTVEAASARYPRSSEKGPTSRQEPDKIQGARVDPTEFFAPGYVWIPIDEIASFPYFTPDQILAEQNDRNVQLHRGLGYSFANYHHAFRYPPYGLYKLGEDIQKLSGHEAEKLFSDINHELFGEERETLTIYNWSTDWADYFNDGHLWWGSFLWTVYSPQTERLVGIATSTSD